ncbi:MAG: DUF5510 family protein [Candidatus Rickettsia vulgarisii]
MSLLTKYFTIAILIFIGCIFESIAFDYSFYTVRDWERIGVLLGIIVMIVSPSKYRVIMIGTVLGLTFSYYTYKYVVPFLFKLL